MRMGSWLLVVAALAAIVALASAGLDMIAPAQGTIGTVFTLTGTDLGSGTPKVTLSAAGKKTVNLKVLTHTDTQVTAQILKLKSGADGVYDLTITPAGSPEGFTRFGEVTIVTGVINTVTPAAPAVGTPVTIQGSGFGTKKGKVIVGGKKAKVTSWTDTEIVATLHKKTPAGSQTLVGLNKVGQFEKADAVDVGGDGGGGGGDPPPGSLPRMTARLYRFTGIADKTQTQVNQVGPGTVVAGTVTGSGGDTYIVSVTFALTNLLTLANGPSNASPNVIQVSTNGVPATVWVATSGFNTKIIARDASVSVDVRCNLPRLTGTDDPETQSNAIITFDIPR